MTNKIKLVLLAAAVIGLSAIPVSLRYPQFARAREDQAKLAKKKTALQAEVDRLRSELRKTGDDEMGTGVAAPAMQRAGANYIPVKIVAIKKLHFTLLDGDYLDGVPTPGSQTAELKVNAHAAGLLALTPDEATSMQNIFTELQDRIQAHHLASVKQIKLEQMGKHNLFDAMTYFAGQTNWGPREMRDPEGPKDTAPPREAGQQTVYEISAMSEEDQTALRKWFADSLANTIGPGRAEIVLMRAEESPDCWLNRGEYVLLAFADRGDPTAGSVSTEWSSVAYNTYHGNASWMGGTGPEPIPARWAYLFREVKDDPAKRRELAQ